jgi:hypothetical protein
MKISNKSMRNKMIFVALIAIVSVAFALPTNAATMAQKLKGRILLQVEEKGEAWYVATDTLERYYLGRPDDAFTIMRALGLGISEEDFVKFQNSVPTKYYGKILLRVKAKGEAYYVNPADKKLYYLGRPADAFDLMRKLGLGISNDNLAKIVDVVYPVTDQSASTSSDAGGTVTTSFKVSSLNHANCGKRNCFEDTFKDCIKNNSVKIQSGLGDYVYKVLGKESGLCKMQSYYTKLINPAWVGKKMICYYDNTKAFTTATAEVFSAMFADNIGKCSGELFQLMTTP